MTLPTRLCGDFLVQLLPSHNDVQRTLPCHLRTMLQIRPNLVLRRSTAVLFLLHVLFPAHLLEVTDCPAAEALAVYVLAHVRLMRGVPTAVADN